MGIEKGSRQLLIHGLALIFVGLVWGLAVPKTPYPRLALGAHVQFEESGILILVVALLLMKVPNRVGRKSVAVILLSAWLLWVMVFSEVGNAWWGTTQMLPIAAREAGAVGGTPWQEMVVKLSHIAAGLGLIVAWGLLMIGFIKTPPEAGNAGAVGH
jgi:(hydroxyamino)benzene mutase